MAKSSAKLSRHFLTLPLYSFNNNTACYTYEDVSHLSNVPKHLQRHLKMYISKDTGQVIEINWLECFQTGLVIHGIIGTSLHQ